MSKIILRGLLKKIRLEVKTLSAAGALYCGLASTETPDFRHVAAILHIAPLAIVAAAFISGVAVQGETCLSPFVKRLDRPEIKESIAR